MLVRKENRFMCGESVQYATYSPLKGFLDQVSEGLKSSLAIKVDFEIDGTGLIYIECRTPSGAEIASPVLIMVNEIDGNGGSVYFQLHAESRSVKVGNFTHSGRMPDVTRVVDVFISECRKWNIRI